jgi:hypothetical protein
MTHRSGPSACSWTPYRTSTIEYEEVVSMAGTGGGDCASKTFCNSIAWFYGC